MSATALSADPITEAVSFYLLGPAGPLIPSSESAEEAKDSLLVSSLVSSHCPSGSYLHEMEYRVGAARENAWDHLPNTASSLAKAQEALLLFLHLSPGQDRSSKCPVQSEASSAQCAEGRRKPSLPP